MMKIIAYLETLGCAKNRVDSEIMLGVLWENRVKITSDPKEAQVMIINTCGFILKAVNESLERILELAKHKKNDPSKKLIVAGCLSERYKGKLLDEIPEIDVLVGTADYSQIFISVINCLENSERKTYFEKQPSYSDNNSKTKRVISTRPHYTYLKIAEGCSNMCSFCNIPKLRGFFKSRSIENIDQEFKRLLKAGATEINLVSQDTSSYGVDLKDESHLFQLVQHLLKSNQENFWLRIFYSYPNSYPTQLFSLMNSDPRLTPYADIPFQHISDSVLKAMNRKITSKKIESLIEQALQTKSDLALRTTFITGFPNETEKDFQQLVDFVEKGYFQHIGVFTYSHEDNISSFKLGDKVPEKVKKERKNILMKAQQRISLKKNNSKIGQTQIVLIEGYSEETDLLLQGRNKYQGPEVDGVVLINDGVAEAGERKTVKITEAHPYDLVGEIV